MNRQSKARGAAWWRGVQLTESACKLPAVAACCRHSASEAATRSRGDGPTGTARHFTVIAEPGKVFDATTAPKHKPQAIRWDRHSLE